MIETVALYLALHQQRPTVDTTHADRHVASTPCTTREAMGETAVGPDPEPWVVLRCRVVWTPILPRTPWVDGTWRSTATWYLHDADGSWFAQAGPGVWRRIEGEP